MHLKERAPGLHGQLRALFTTAEVAQLETVFSWCAAAGGDTEGTVQREEGVSFNARPARICQIILSEGGSCTVTELSAAMLALVPSLTTSHQPPPGLDNALTLADKARTAVAGGESRREGELSLSATEKIAAAIMLDDLRHLHMTTLPSSARATLIGDAERFCAGFTDLAPSPRLIVLLSTAIDRCRKIEDAR